ncbi:MAG TPA: BTAD domain-containing putative transcriptional regulator [Acidimicrobiales bacterium]|nr:BTAD domain-containing putative transcriptional regulator [Acidimicrobiales bacterium]
MAEELVVRLLGPVRVLTGEGSEVELRGNAARLTAWLALHPGRAWSVADLADRLWPAGPPPTARTAIQGHVSKLRRRLGPDGPVRIETAADGYLLRIVPGGGGGRSADDPGPAGGDGAGRSPVDVHRFTGLCERAAAERSAGRERAAVRLLDEALALWAGDALAEVRNDDPVLAARAAVLDDGRHDAEDALADALVAGRETDRALPLLGRLVDDDPLRERRWALLMTALTQAGRQTDALRAYRRAAAILVERTGLDPGPELRRLETAILLQDPSLDAARWQPATASAPSPVTGVVGRDTERAEVVGRLADARVVTLTGPGGVGKSTLAIDVAAAAAGTFDDGAVVVDLGSSGPGDVGLVIAAAVGAPVLPEGGAASGEDADSGDPLVRAATVLARREVLVVLDGCEHVRRQAARAAVVLAQAGPGLRILATSQVPLGVAGEVVVALAPLAIPSPGAAETAIRRSAAVELLARRLDDMGSPVQTGAEWRAVADIVRAIDGLPLAIELVAASARTEPLADLARRVSADVSTVLGADPPVGAGRLTLGATLDAAVDRLDEGAVHLYGLLSVFPGSFDTTAAAALLDGDEPAARAALAVLADASLLVLDRPGRRRARLLQPVRAHAAGRIDDATRRTALERLTRWSLDLAAELDRTLHSPRQAEVIERFVVELPTFRAVLRRLIDEGDVARAARLFEDLATCWGDSPASVEAQLWADELLPLADRLPPGPRAHLEVAIVHCQYAFELMAAKLDLAERALARAEQAGDRFATAAAQMQVAIALGWRNTDLERAEALLDAARAGMTEIGHPHWAAVALEFRGLVALRRLDIAGGIATLEAAVSEHRTSGGAGDVAHALMFIGFARRAVGDQPGARRAFEEARRVLGDVRVATWLRATVGAAHASLAMGDTEAAAETFRSAHDRAVEVGDRRIVGTALVGLAAVARNHGDDERCVALLVGATDEALGGGDPTDAVAAAGMLAEMLVARGAVEEAAVVLGAGDLVEEEVEVRVDFGLAPDLGPVRATAAERLGEHEAARLGRDGRVIGLPAAVRRAGERLFDDPSGGSAVEAGRRPRTEARRR